MVPATRRPPPSRIPPMAHRRRRPHLSSPSEVDLWPWSAMPPMGGERRRDTRRLFRPAIPRPVGEGPRRAPTWDDVTRYLT